MVILLHAEDEEKLPSQEEFFDYGREQGFATGNAVISFYRPASGAGGIFRYLGKPSEVEARRVDREGGELYAASVHVLFITDPATSRCVAGECEEVVSALAGRFGLRLRPELDSEDTVPYTRDGFLKLWEDNCISFLSGLEEDTVSWGIDYLHQALTSSAPREDSQPLTPAHFWDFPAEKLRAVHEWNRWVDRQWARRGRLFGPACPAVKFILDSKDEVRTAALWIDAQPIVLPRTDFVVLQRREIVGRRKSHARDSEVGGISLVPFARLRSLLRPFPRSRRGLDCWTLDYPCPPRKVRRLFEMEQPVKEELFACHASRLVEEDLLERAEAALDERLFGALV